jgi:hypothetical protein
MYYGADSFSNRHNGDRAAQRGANRIYRNLRRNISAILRAIRAAPRRAVSAVYECTPGRQRE